MSGLKFTYCTDVKTEQTTFEWTIRNFSLLLEDKGTAIHSPIFHSQNKKEKWKILFYPRGEKEDCISLYLYLTSATSSVKVQCQLSIIQRGLVIERRTLTHKYSSPSGWGFPNFVERSRLSGRGTDNFIISCKIDKPVKTNYPSLSNTLRAVIREKIVKPSKNIPSQFNSPAAMPSGLSVDKKNGRLIKNFADLLTSSKFSDVIIIVKEKKFAVHKAILAARSPVFAAMFDNKEMNENKTNEIKIEKMEPCVVEGMLQFIYTDHVCNFDAISNGLLSAADKYDLVLLKALCEENLAKTLRNETAVETLVLADLHHSDNLKAHVMHFMNNHLVDIIDTKDYKELEEKYPGLLIEFIRFMALQKKSQKS